MPLDISPDLETILQAEAQAKGVNVEQLLQDTFAPQAEQKPASIMDIWRRLKPTGRTAEEIDADINESRDSWHVPSEEYYANH